MIEVKNLSKKFGSKQVLNDINFNLEKGKTYGIVGNNGAGKTTLFRCLVGLEKYNGTINSEYDLLKNHVGLLETNPTFMSRITGWEYLKLVCSARNIKSDDFESQNIFNLPLNEYAESYSTGMKKKLALLGILLQKNEVFILDEPYNGVDIQSNIIITEIIKELKNRNKIVLISSHIFSTLSDTCDQIMLLAAGKMERSFNPENYHELEKEMRTQVIHTKISKLDF